VTALAPGTPPRRCASSGASGTPPSTCAASVGVPGSGPLPASPPVPLPVPAPVPVPMPVLVLVPLPVPAAGSAPPPEVEGLTWCLRRSPFPAPKFRNHHHHDGMRGEHAHGGTLHHPPPWLPLPQKHNCCVPQQTRRQLVEDPFCNALPQVSRLSLSLSLSHPRPLAFPVPLLSRRLDLAFGGLLCCSCVCGYRGAKGRPSSVQGMLGRETAPGAPAEEVPGARTPGARAPERWQGRAGQEGQKGAARAARRTKKGRLENQFQSCVGWEVSDNFMTSSLGLQTSLSASNQRGWYY